MKRILTLIAAVLLALGVLAGCVSIDLTIRNTPAEVSATPSPKELTRGVIEGNVYTNESLELKFTAPEGWKFTTDDEYEKIMGFGVYDGLKTYDMFAYNTSSGVSVTVIYEYLAANETISIEGYIDLIKKSLKATYDDPKFSDHAKVGIGSNTFNVIAMDCSDIGMTQYYYVHKAGSYMLCIMVTTHLGSGADSIMANFS